MERVIYVRELRVRESIEYAPEARSVDAGQLGGAAMIPSSLSECLVGEDEKAVNGV
jgi:hypothetical protein